MEIFTMNTEIHFIWRQKFTLFKTPLNFTQFDLECKLKVNKVIVILNISHHDSTIRWMVMASLTLNNLGMFFV